MKRYRVRAEDAGKRPIKVRVRNRTNHATFYVWRCRYCNARGDHFRSPGEAADRGLRHYWERCVTSWDLDVVEARENGTPAAVERALSTRLAQQLLRAAR